MRASIAYLFALASAVLAADPTSDFDAITVPASVDAGSTVKVTWTIGSPTKYTGPVTVSLIGGPSQPKLVPISTIATDVDNSALSYEWAVDSSLGKDALYGLTFVLNSDKSVFQYSNPFTIKASSSGGSTNSTSGGSGSASSTTSVASTTATSQSTSTSVTVVTSTPSSSVPYGNSSTTGPTQVTNTQTSTRTSSTAAATNTGGAAQLGAGSLALAGGLAIAVLAL